jgi:hypothetical protein
VEGPLVAHQVDGQSIPPIRSIGQAITSAFPITLSSGT